MNNTLKEVDWVIGSTSQFKLIQEYVRKSHDLSIINSLIGISGLGKSTALKQYCSINEDAYYLLIDKTFSKADLYVNLLRLINKHEYGYDTRIHFLALKLAKVIKEKQRKVLIIIDDAGRFQANQLEFIQCIYESADGYLGIILSGTSKFKNDFQNWVRHNKQGIPELDTRIHRWIDLPIPNKEELKAVAILNGVAEEKALNEVLKNCNNYRTLFLNVLEYRNSNKYQKIKQ